MSPSDKERRLRPCPSCPPQTREEPGIPASPVLCSLSVFIKHFTYINFCLTFYIAVWFGVFFKCKKYLPCSWRRKLWDGSIFIPAQMWLSALEDARCFKHCQTYGRAVERLPSTGSWANSPTCISFKNMGNYSIKMNFVILVRTAFNLRRETWKDTPLPIFYNNDSFSFYSPTQIQYNAIPCLVLFFQL